MVSFVFSFTDVYRWSVLSLVLKNIQMVSFVFSFADMKEVFVVVFVCFLKITLIEK